MKPRSDIDFMREAQQLAAQAKRAGEVPVGPCS
jgi:tRNA(Arg) A34 adenosine deaminase TadA